MLVAFSSPGIYTRYVQLPRTDALVHASILDNPKFHPFFEDTVMTMSNSGSYLVTPVASQLYSSTPVALAQIYFR